MVFIHSQIPYVGTKFMFISGIFLNAGCNILFGYVNPYSTFRYHSSEFDTIIIQFCSMLPGIQNNTQFAIFCFVVRGFEAVGAGAFSTASFIYVIHMFPDNVSAVLVSTAEKNADEIFSNNKNTIILQGVMETFAGLGMSIGPAFGGFLYAVKRITKIILFASI